MTVVTGGYGLPEEGSIVAGGMGLAEQVEGAMVAHLSGSGALTATLTGVEEHPFIPGAAFVQPRRDIRVTVGSMSATVSGSSALSANLTRDPLSLTDDEFNAQVIMLLEGVTV